MFVELSYLVGDWCPGEVLDIAPPKIHSRARFGDGQNKSNQTSIIEIFSHNGTHVDVPWHVAADRRKICDYSIEDFVFTKPVCIECKKPDKELITAADIAVHSNKITGSDLLLVYTGHGQYRQDDVDRYVTDSPSFSVEAAEFILERFPSVRCVGIDVFGVENIPDGRKTGWPVHKAFLVANRPFLLIEDMKLDHVADKKIHSVVVAPLRALGLDGSPCTVIAHIDAE